MTPDMVKTVSGMFSRMSPEELQNMMKMCSTLPRQNQASSSTFNDTRNRHSVMGSSQSVSVDNGLFEENHNRVGESSMNLSSIHQQRHLLLKRLYLQKKFQMEKREMQRLLRILLSFSCFGLLKSNADHKLMERNF